MFKLPINKSGSSSFFVDSHGEFIVLRRSDPHPINAHGQKSSRHALRAPRESPPRPGCRLESWNKSLPPSPDWPAAQLCKPISRVRAALCQSSLAYRPSEHRKSEFRPKHSVRCMPTHPNIITHTPFGCQQLWLGLPRHLFGGLTSAIVHSGFIGYDNI